MKITFIGTSHGVPETHKRCSCTMLEVSGRYYFIDMGTGVISDLRTRGIPIEDVRGIFITHCHGDHTNGLIPFVDLINWYFKKADPTIMVPSSVLIDGLTAWIRANGGDRLRDMKFGIVHEGEIYDDEFIKVTAIPTKHCPTPSYAYLVEAEGKRIIFTGDLAHGTAEDFPVAAYELETELIVAECAHFPPSVIEEQLSKAKTKRVFINHFNENYRGAELLEYIHRPHHYICKTATDGLEINI